MKTIMHVMVLLKIIQMVLYYSPSVQKALYGYLPNWDFELLTEINVEGCENDDFKFYKYN